MRTVILFGESVHYGMAAASRVICYAKGLEHAGGKAEIVMPFGFIAKENIAFTKKGMINGASYKYVSYLGYHPKRKYPFPISGIVLVGTKKLATVKYLLYLLFNRSSYDVAYIYRFSTFYTLLLLLVTAGKVRVSELCEIPYHDRVGKAKQFHRRVRELILLPLFDAFVAISENLRLYADRFKGRKARILKVPILTEGDATGNGHRSELLPEVPFLLHTGSISERKDGVVGMINAFGLAKQQLKTPVKFIMTGHLQYSADKAAIQEAIDKYGLQDSVVFTGFLPKEDLQSLQAHCSLSIVNKYENEQNLYCFPTKLAEYMKFGIPVIATQVGEMGSYLEDNVTAYLTQPGDIQMLAEKIVRAFAQRGERDIIAANGRQLAMHDFNCYFQGGRMKDFFEELKQVKGR